MPCLLAHIMNGCFMPSNATDPDKIAKARHLAQEIGRPLAAIAREVGLPVSTLRGIARRQGWRANPAPTTASPIIPELTQGQQRAGLIARLWRAAERHMAVIDAELAAGGSATCVRDMAVLSKILRDLDVLEKAHPPEPAPQEAEGASLEGLRTELLRRLKGLEQEGA